MEEAVHVRSALVRFQAAELETNDKSSSEARRAGGGGAHFRGVDTEAEMGEVGLAEGHEAGVQVAPDEEEQEGNRGVILVGDSVDDGAGKVETKQDFCIRHPAGFIPVFFCDECSFFPFDIEFGRPRELAFLAHNRFQDRLRIAHGNADAHSHDERHVEKRAPPVLRAKLALRHDIKAGDGARGSEE